MPTIEFSTEELRKIKCHILEQGISPDKFDDKELPTDVHIINYKIGSENHFDVVRAHTMVDIFDAFHDKIKDIGQIISIKSGFGKISPKLYGKIPNS